MKPGRRFVETGGKGCSDADVLALLIGSGGPGYSAEDVAREILERFGTLAGIMDAPLRDLADIRGVGPVRAIRIAAAYELTSRVVHYLEQNG